MTGFSGSFNGSDWGRHPRHPGGRVRSQPVPATPTFIPSGPIRQLRFKSVAGLCRHIHRLRANAGLELKRQVAALPGTDTFPVIEIHRRLDDDTTYLGVAAVQGLSREAFEDALREAETPAAQASCRLDRHQPSSLLVLE